MAVTVMTIQRNILLLLTRFPVCVAGSGGVPAGRTQGSGESQTRPRQTNQDARVCLETRTVSQLS